MTSEKYTQFIKTLLSKKGYARSKSTWFYDSDCSDWAAQHHIHECNNGEWIPPEDDRPFEDVAFYGFAGTDCDRTPSTGIEMTGFRCACGEYEEVTVRWEGTTGAAMDLLSLMP